MQSRPSSVEPGRLCVGSLFSKQMQDMGSLDRFRVVTHTWANRSVQHGVFFAWSGIKTLFSWQWTIISRENVYSRMRIGPSDKLH